MTATLIWPSKEELLTHHTWKMEELTQVENNTQIYYKRGGTANTHNFDNDKITFLADGTGNYSPTPAQNFNITWEFTNTSKTQMDIVITFSPSLITTLKCTELATDTKQVFLCDQLYKRIRSTGFGKRLQNTFINFTFTYFIKR